MSCGIATDKHAQVQIAIANAGVSAGNQRVAAIAVSQLSDHFAPTKNISARVYPRISSGADSRLMLAIGEEERRLFRRGAIDSMNDF